MKHGRRNHTDNDKQLIFVCYVVTKLRELPEYAWRKAFLDLTKGRDDIEEIRRLAWERLK